MDRLARNDHRLRRASLESLQRADHAGMGLGLARNKKALVRRVKDYYRGLLGAANDQRAAEEAAAAGDSAALGALAAAESQRHWSAIAEAGGFAARERQRAGEAVPGLQFALHQRDEAGAEKAARAAKATADAAFHDAEARAVAEAREREREEGLRRAAKARARRVADRVRGAAQAQERARSRRARARLLDTQELGARRERQVAAQAEVRDAFFPYASSPQKLPPPARGAAAAAAASAAATSAAAAPPSPSPSSTTAKGAVAPARRPLHAAANAMLHGDVSFGGRVYHGIYRPPVDGERVNYEGDEGAKRREHLRELHAQQAHHHILRAGAEPPTVAFGVAERGSWQTESARRGALDHDPARLRERRNEEARQRNFVLSMAATRTIAGAAERTAGDAAARSSPERRQEARREVESSPRRQLALGAGGQESG